MCFGVGEEGEEARAGNVVRAREEGSGKGDSKIETAADCAYGVEEVDEAPRTIT